MKPIGRGNALANRSFISHLLHINIRTPVGYIYLRYIALVMMVIYPVALTQAYRFFDSPPPQFLLAPTLAAIIIGSLLSRSVRLKFELQAKSEQFRAIADLAQEFTYLRSIDGSYEYVSPSCINLTGYEPQDFYSTPNFMDQLIHPDDMTIWKRHVHDINDNGSPETLDLRLLKNDGTIVWFNHICMPVNDEDGKQIGVRSTNLDITKRKQDEKRIENMAYYDALTHLPNRRSLQRHLEQLMSNNIENKQHFPVLFLDLDRFKNINDGFGHQFGDRLLHVIAQRIEHISGENNLVCRFGGDEFVVVLANNTSTDTANLFAVELLAAIEESIELDGIELHISASIGISFYPDDGNDADTLIRNADVAMYKTKKEGSGNIRIYSASDSAEATRFITTETKIHKALQENEFVVYYQPKVDMVNGNIIGMEALARWIHPVQGLIPPCDFISVAEETGQIIPLAKQLLQQVLTDLARWQQAGIALPVSVNVSARQFADMEFCNRIMKMINDANIPPSLLELEVTEQVFLGDIDTACERLMQLHKYGLSIALDDFGTGYSSFGYLRQLPIDTLKIDRSFICNIETDKAEIAIIRAIISMCSEMRLNVVVEGIETLQQSDALLSLGCNIAQGFYYHRPMPVDELNRLLSPTKI